MRQCYYYGVLEVCGGLAARLILLKHCALHGHTWDQQIEQTRPVYKYNYDYITRGGVINSHQAMIRLFESLRGLLGTIRTYKVEKLDDAHIKIETIYCMTFYYKCTVGISLRETSFTKVKNLIQWGHKNTLLIGLSVHILNKVVGSCLESYILVVYLEYFRVFSFSMSTRGITHFLSNRLGFSTMRLEVKYKWICRT
jgi:hypothetical protein